MIIAASLSLFTDWLDKMNYLEVLGKKETRG
jgi:hypothetical protein